MLAQMRFSHIVLILRSFLVWCFGIHYILNIVFVLMFLYFQILEISDLAVD